MGGWKSLSPTSIGLVSPSINTTTSLHTKGLATIERNSEFSAKKKKKIVKQTPPFQDFKALEG
jgi:hypothetical protein